MTILFVPPNHAVGQVPINVKYLKNLNIKLLTYNLRLYSISDTRNPSKHPCKPLGGFWTLHGPCKDS